jgi:two-component system OmpR family response regulator/two-component system copper resistance phosphate regulon response regulator CusR
MNSRAPLDRNPANPPDTDAQQDEGSAPMNLLVVEDDPVMGKSLSKGLMEAGHKCTWVKDGKHGLQQALSHRFDAIILDLLLPGISGLEVLRQIRAAGVRTPVLMLTALGAVEERVAGLMAGADDYVVKPFAFPELMARLEAVCRRTADRPPAVMSSGELRLDLTTRRVQYGDMEVDLTPTEFSILELLMRHAGQVVTRKMLCEHLWETDWEGTTNVIEVHINRIRKKLDRDDSASLIQTVRGRGYALRAH